MIQSKACLRSFLGVWMIAGVVFVLLSGTAPGVFLPPDEGGASVDAGVGSQPLVETGLDPPSVRAGTSSGETTSSSQSVPGEQAAASVDEGGESSGFVAGGVVIGVIVLSLLLLWSLVGVWAFLLVALLAGWRLDREKVLEHPIRKVILKHLEKHPGATAQELADAAEVRNRRAVYHLSILLREECVSVRTVEGRKHYFTRMAPKADLERLRLRPFVRSSRPGGKILALLARNPGATVSQVARMMGFAPGHAHYHLTKLATHGLVDRLRRGRRVRHYLTTLGHDMVAPELQTEHGVSPALKGQDTEASDSEAAEA